MFQNYTGRERCCSNDQKELEITPKRKPMKNMEMIFLDFMVGKYENKNENDWLGIEKMKFWITGFGKAFFITLD